VFFSFLLSNQFEIFPAQGNQLTDFDGSQIQTTQNFGKVIPQAAVSIQGSRGWPSNQPLEQGNNQITTSDQRKTLGMFY
jgi:hypothetical protein